MQCGAFGLRVAQRATGAGPPRRLPRVAIPLRRTTTLSISASPPIPAAPTQRQTATIVARPALVFAWPLAEGATVMALVAAAVVVRLPRLWVTPWLTDEWQEVGQSLAIARGEALPLTNYDA